MDARTRMELEQLLARYQGDHTLGDVVLPPVPPFEPGDACEDNGQARPKQSPPPKQDAEPFADPIPCSALQKVDAEDRWLWEGILARGSITLFSALWKSGKSTLLAHMVKGMEHGGDLCGQRLTPCSVLYVTEEHGSLWADRRDELQIGDHVWFQVRPFPAKPRWERWHEFLFHLKAWRADRPFDALVLDTISNLWPVRDENDNAQVQSALMPLQQIGDDLAILIVHHLRKGDGQEATGSRGAGALTAFADILLELRRYNAADRKDRRRVLTGYGRFRDIPDEVVIELAPDFLSYRAQGDRTDVVRKQVGTILAEVLPNEAPGITFDDIAENWPGETMPTKKSVLAALAGTQYRREGNGKRGSPYTYWLPVGDSQPYPAGSTVPFRRDTDGLPD